MPCPRRRATSLTLAFTGQMEQIWTNTVPRRLVTRTASARGGTVARQRNTPVTAEIPIPRVSTRSVVNRPVTAASGNATVRANRYVQVGTFGSPANARRAAERLKQAGLPARIGRIQRRGQTLEVVLTGPFQQTASLNDALRRARSAGFTGALLRR